MRPHVRSTFRLAQYGVTALVLLTATTSSNQALGQSPLASEADSLVAAFDNQTALQAYREALKQGGSYDLLFKATTAALLAGDQATETKEALFEEAVEYATRLRERYPDRPGSWTMLAASTGQLAVFRGPREKARVARGVYTYVREAIALDSTYAYAYVMAGILAREISKLGWFKRFAANAVLGGVPPGTLEESRDHLSRAVELAPRFIIARWEYAKTCRAMGRDDEAVVHLRHISRLTPTNSEEARLQQKAAVLASEITARLEAAHSTR